MVNQVYFNKKKVRKKSEPRLPVKHVEYFKCGLLLLKGLCTSRLYYKIFQM